MEVVEMLAADTVLPHRDVDHELTGDWNAIATATSRQGHSGLGLEAEQMAVREFVALQGWTLIGEYSDIASGKDDRRFGFQTALARCRKFGAVLVAARLDPTALRAHRLSQLLEDGISVRATERAERHVDGSRPDTCRDRSASLLPRGGAGYNGI